MCFIIQHFLISANWVVPAHRQWPKSIINTYCLWKGIPRIMTFHLSIKFSMQINYWKDMSEEGRTGVFSWCVIGSFYFLWNVNLGNYSSWLVTWRFWVTREEPELLTDNRDFTAKFYVILARKFSKLLELSIENDLGMRFAIWSLDSAIRDFASFKYCF